MKILNLYAGIGGNRKLWTPNGNEHEIIAVEKKPGREFEKEKIENLLFTFGFEFKLEIRVKIENSFDVVSS